MTGTRLLTLGATIGAIALLTPRARAQSEGFDNFTMSPVRGHAFVTGEYETDQRNQADRDTSSTDRFSQQGLELRTDGSIYHPNFFHWNGMVRLGLSQQDSEYDDESRTSNGILLGYNLDGVFLQRKPTSLRVFSNLSQNHTTRDFAEPFEYETSSHGFELRHHGALDTRLLFEYATHHESSQTRVSDETIYRLQLNSRYRREHVDLDFEYEHQSINETLNTGGGDSDFRTESDELNLRNVIKFGDGPHPHTLTGFSSITDRRGFFSTSTINLNQRLTLYHTPTFNTFYGGAFRHTTSDGQDDSSVSGEAGFNKKIYESLDINGRVRIEQDEFTDGEEQRYGGDFAALYRKKTPVGAYTSSLRLNRTYEHERSGQGTRRVIGEVISFAGFEYVALGRTNVVLSSITVSNIDRTIIYDEGVHYNVRQTGAITEIQRIDNTGSAFETMPDSVLVDYTANIARDAEYVRDRIFWSHRIMIDALRLSPYISFELYNETLQSGEDPGNLQHHTTITAGIDYILDRFTAGYEFQTFDTNIGLSYNSHRVHARYNRNIGRDLNFNIGGDAQWLTYTNADSFNLTDDESWLNTYHLFAQFANRINKNMLWRTRCDWHNISGRQNSMNAELTTSLEWRFRQLELSVDGRYRIFEQEATDGRVMGVMFELRRYF